MNQHQGLGFVVLTKVMDKKTLNMVGLTVISFVSTSVPLVMAVLTPDAQPRNGECTLSGVEISTIRSVVANATCNYNVTLNDVLTGNV
jgi:hypothetical protein